MWVKIPTSRPSDRLGRVREIVGRYGAALNLDALFVEVERKAAYALISSPSDPVNTKAMLTELEALEAVFLLDTDEADAAYDRAQSG
jgi:hypothetical protein